MHLHLCSHISIFVNSELKATVSSPTFWAAPHRMQLHLSLNRTSANCQQKDCSTLATLCLLPKPEQQSYSCTETQISLLIQRKTIPPKEKKPLKHSDQWIDPIHCTAAQSLCKINQNLKLPTDAVATLILVWLSTASSKSAVSCSAQKAWQMGEVCGRQSVCQKRWHVCSVVN